MRRDNILVFDDYVSPHNPATVAFSPATLNRRLGRFDQLAVMALVDNLNNNTDGFNIWLAHSADNLGWLYITPDSPARPSNGEIHWDASPSGNQLSTTATNIGTFLFAGAPLLEFIRLEMAFTSSNTGGHVRIYVTQRDQGA